MVRPRLHSLERAALAVVAVAAIEPLADPWLGFWPIIFWPLPMALPFLALLAVGGLAIAAWRASSRIRWAALGIAIIIVAVLWSGALQRAGEWLRFEVERPAYERAATRAQAGQLRSGAKIAGHHIALDSGPPLRIAFIWAGLGDNWRGVVRDPSGIVASARGWGERPGDYTATPEAKKLFGGDLVTCRPLGKPYYLCSFT